MGGENKFFQEMDFKKDEYCKSVQYSSSMDESLLSSSSSSSISSSLGTELADDASSSSSSGPLFELAELMAQLPIKRGLSKFYHGKSQTFGSLANIKNVQDLAKKESSYSQRMKLCKSYGGNLNRHKFGPKANITKRFHVVRRSFSPHLCAKSVIAVD